MAEGKQVESALLTEHFRYTPLTLLDEIINTVNELVYQAVSAVERGLLDAPPEALGFGRSEDPDNNNNDENAVAAASAAAAVEIENGVHQLETLLQSTVDRNFDKLEIYVLRNVLSVPADLIAWVRLKHYENLQFSPSSSEATNANNGIEKSTELTPESLLQLRRKVQESQKLNASLRAEARRNDAILAQLRGLLGISASMPVSLKADSDRLIPNPNNSATSATNDDGYIPQSQPNFSFLINTLEAQKLGLPLSLDPNVKQNSKTDHPVKTATAFALSQLPALKDSLAQLKPEIQGLRELVDKLERQGQLQDPGYIKNGEGSGRMNNKLNAADERAVYIETQARLQLERRGVDVGGGLEDSKDANEVRARKKKISPEEVQSLERIATGLGGQTGNED